MRTTVRIMSSPRLDGRQDVRGNEDVEEIVDARGIVICAESCDGEIELRNEDGVLRAISKLHVGLDGAAAVLVVLDPPEVAVLARTELVARRHRTIHPLFGQHSAPAPGTA